MNYLRRLPLRPAAYAALTALFALALVAPSLSPAAHAQLSAPKAPAGPNGKIVFESDQAGDQEGINDIYTMDADGRHQTRLTTDAAHDGSAVWSPDGTKIAFISNRRGTFEIYLMNADGSNQRPLRAEGVQTFDSVEWSPDGTRLAYVNGGEACVVEAVAPGGGDSVVAPWSVSTGRLLGSSDIGVSWSPDGTRLVVRNAESCGGCSDLYAVNADGTGRVKLSTGVGFDTEPRWSPDGTRVAYEGDRNGRAIYVTNADGTGTETLLSGAVGSFGGPEWSPDGTRLAFSSDLGVIHVVNADGTGLTALNEQTLTGSRGPFWSPDGKQVAFQESGDIFVVNADGTSRRASNYTKTRRATEFAGSWQRIVTP